MLSKLSGSHKDWLEARIQQSWESAELANSVLFEEADVPPFPNKEEVLQQLQTEIEPNALDLMMNGDDVEGLNFSFITKLVAPSPRLDLLNALLNRHTKDARVADHPVDKFWTWNAVQEHLRNCSSRVSSPTWFWEFGQGSQVLPENLSPQNETERQLIGFLNTMPHLMRGTDRFTWATRMAMGLREGKPFDVDFPNDAGHFREFKSWSSTVLDEEGKFFEARSAEDERLMASGPYLVTGYFGLDRGRPCLGAEYINDIYPKALRHFRMSIDGKIKS